MPFVPGMQCDVFVSYATANNQAVRQDSPGWVTLVIQELTRQLDGALGRSGASAVWMDNQLTGAGLFDAQLQDRLAHTAILLIVLSRASLLAPWCQQELELFIGRDLDKRDRIFLMHYEPTNSTQWPPKLQGLSDAKYRFFQQEPSSDVSVPFGFPLPMPAVDRPLYLRVYELAEDLAAKLQELAAQAITPLAAHREELAVQATTPSVSPMPPPLVSPVALAVPLYTMHGLKAAPRHDDIVQDFIIQRGAGGQNVNGVYFQWADTFCNNTIHASIEQQEPRPFLRVRFQHRPRSLGCNVAIRPAAEAAVANGADPHHLRRRYLSLQARIPPKALLTGADAWWKRQSLLTEIAIAVRVVDRALTYWKYAMPNSNDQYQQFEVKGAEWQTLSVDLESQEAWALFMGDGNYLVAPDSRDFSIIAGLTLLFGSWVPTEPGPGMGVIDLADIRLRGEL